jgi:PEP-CTERM motif
VTDLGFFDASGSAGLSNSHPVGIWNSGGVLLGSATVPAGTTGTLLDGFRFVSVTPFTLGAGDYTIGAYGSQTSSDQFEWGLSGSSSVAGLSMGNAVISGYGPTALTLPTTVEAVVDQAYFGPDFMVASPAAVPEPPTANILAIMLGLAGFFRVVRRKRRSPLTDRH